MLDNHRLTASLLAPTVDPARLGFEDTSQMEPLDETIGQERAVEALEFGLQMKSPGFNIFVSGPVGTGKGTLVRQMVKRLAQTAPSPPDWCFVHNFQDASRPACLSFPTVRAFASSEALGDRGWLGSAELRYAFSPSIVGSVFHDRGEVSVNASPYLTTPNTLRRSGNGFGVTGSFGSFDWRASVAWREGKAGTAEPDRLPRMWAQAGWRF